MHEKQQYFTCVFNAFQILTYVRNNNSLHECVVHVKS